MIQSKDMYRLISDNYFPDYISMVHKWPLFHWMILYSFLHVIVIFPPFLSLGLLLC